MGISFWLALERSGGTRLGRRRTLVALGVLGFALLWPAAALASHMFSDVPTSHTFHTNISNLANAGVTAGCGGGKYCPGAPVTRGQMAGFLNRGLGRIAEGDLNTDVLGTALTVVRNVTITPGTSPGALPGAKQFVRALFTGSIYLTDATDCPCQVVLYQMVGTSSAQTFASIVTVTTAFYYYPISAGGVIEVSGSDPVTINLQAGIQQGGGSSTSYTVVGNLTAETVPFGSTGTNAP